jgi:hypothetical protein
MDIIIGTTKLNNAANGVIKSSNSLTKNLHLLGVSLIHHAMTEGAGDLSIAAKVVVRAGKGTRIQQWKTWMEENTGYKFLPAREGKEAKFKRPKNWTKYPHELEDLPNLEPFYVAKERPTKAWDAASWAKRGIDKAFDQGVSKADLLAAVEEAYAAKLATKLDNTDQASVDELGATPAEEAA